MTAIPEWTLHKECGTWNARRSSSGAPRDIVSGSSVVPSFEVQRGPVRLTVYGRAVLVPRDARQIVAAAPSTVGEIHVQPGAPVETGDLLASLHSEEADRTLGQALEDYAAAVASAAEVAVQNREKAQERALQVLRAENALKVATLERDAQERLVRTGVAGKIALERARLDAELRASELEAARALAADEANAGRARTAVADAKVAAAGRQRDRAQATVDALEIRAPFDGTVAALSATVGQHVAMGATIAEVVGSSLDARAEVLDADAAALKPGMLASVRVGGAEAKATVTAVGARAERGIVSVHLAVDAGAVPLGRADSVGEAEFVVSEIADALSVAAPPSVAPGFNGTVSVEGTEGFEARVVSLGQRAGDRIVVLAGLTEGDRVRFDEGRTP